MFAAIIIIVVITYGFMVMGGEPWIEKNVNILIGTGNL